MTEYNMFEAKTNLSKITGILEDHLEDYVIICRNGKPLLRITLEENNDVSKRIGAGKGMIRISEDFDDMDISMDFEGEIFK